MANNRESTSALLNLLQSSSQDGNQFVTFKLDNEEYGIPIKSVQEISANKELTPLPNSPEFVRGILNLRGNIIPVLDPRIKFGLPNKEHSHFSVIIIFASGQRTIGMLVDKISDVLTIEKKNIEETPEIATDINTKFIDGIGKVANKFVIILNLEKIFTKEDIEVK